MIPFAPAKRVRVAFLGHNQPLDRIIRPAGGYLSKDDAEGLVRDFLAERISQKAIRAFPPQSSFRILRPYLRTIPVKLPPVEVENCKFVPPNTCPRPPMVAIRAGWDWSVETTMATA